MLKKVIGVPSEVNKDNLAKNDTETKIIRNLYRIAAI
jgi:hypothetical protein